ncbi:DUF2169 domain-containing protein [Niveibacterium sp. 24ML]|uniref:DUF2169 family type VI secretion system accessory protein n=1 Tax=Niveibacterium sp. 24ML TaxID=2985512 RepID=UPI00226E1D9F|nr:DUF2169 domain-containing protein [Niveibacterium sp. 24ML]MCX9156609.1 DUF2169 domain-containing protein [Niveibacterium sp. 24ML]
MLQVDNRTPFPAVLSVFPAPSGVETAYAALKITYDLTSGRPVPSPRQAGFLAADVYWGDPTSSSLRAAGDVTLLKPTTDIMLIGRAISISGPVGVMDVTLQVGPVIETLRVSGERFWTRDGKSWRPTDPKAFDRMPLRWELAYGGTTPPNPDQPMEVEARNPVGRGFIGSWETDFEGRPLPCIESPECRITTPQDRPAPVGYAPVAPVWQFRSRHAGTYDEAWQKTRAPHLPFDFNPLFLHAAPPALISPSRLEGGEDVVLRGVAATPLAFALPEPDVELEFDFAGANIASKPLLDTVLFEPDTGRMQMVWRAELAVDKRLLKLRTLRVAYDKALHP